MPTSKTASTAQDGGAESQEEHVSGKVLVVDDEVNIVELLVGWLETIGCDVIQANNGAQAIEQARLHQPDLILMDCMMPEVSGFDACQTLKADPDLQEIPVIFLTVRNEVQDVVTGLELAPFTPSVAIHVSSRELVSGSSVLVFW